MMQMIKKGWEMSKDIDLTIKAYLGVGVLLALVATLIGLVNELQFVVIAGVLPEWLDYGYLRPVYTSLLIFGSLLSLFFGYAYNEIKGHGPVAYAPVAFAGFKLHMLGLAVGVSSILLGWSKGREYGEFVWLADQFIVLPLIAFLVTSIVALRQAGKANVSALLAIATAAGAAAIYLVGNLNLPYAFHASISLVTGSQDSALQEIYRGGILGYFIIFPSLSILYSLVPAYYKVELYSESLAHFVIAAGVVMIPVAGLAGIVFAPTPEGLQTVGVVGGIAFAVVALAGAVNANHSVKRSGKIFHSDSMASILRVCIWFLAVAAILRAVLAPRFVQAAFGYTWLNPRDLTLDAQTYGLWVMIAGTLYLLQKMTERNLSSRFLFIVAFIAIGGIGLMYTGELIHGAAQAHVQSAFAQDGTLANPGWNAVVFAGSLYEGDDLLLRYLVGPRGVYLLGFAMIAIAILMVAGQFFVSLRKKGSGYNQPDLAVGESEGGYLKEASSH